jgi:hypothetical protein
VRHYLKLRVEGKQVVDGIIYRAGVIKLSQCISLDSPNFAPQLAFDVTDKPSKSQTAELCHRSCHCRCPLTEAMYTNWEIRHDAQASFVRKDAGTSLAREEQQALNTSEKDIQY